MPVTEFTERLAAQGARLEEYRGAQSAAVYSDARTEFAALRSDCGVYDLGWRTKVALTGGDRERWLNGMVTNNVRDLAAGHGVYAFLLNPQGHIQGDLYVYNRGGHFLVDTDQGQVEKILGVFDHYIIMDDVEVTRVGEKLTAIGVAGPKSQDVLRAAGLEISELVPLEFRDVTWQDTGLTMVRGDNPAVDSYELWLAPASLNLVWDTLIKTGATPAGTQALEWLRIACGIPRYGQDIRERDLPQETGQARALHFSKGCYVGQEIVERIHSRGSVRRTFAGFAIEGTLPAAGAKITAGGKDAGEITSSVLLPMSTKDFPVALGYIRREVGAPGKQVAAGSAKAIVHEIPFTEVFER